MYVGGINFTSLLFMNVYRIYILLVWFDQKEENYFWVYLCPFVDDWQKGGEKFGVLFMHVYAWFSCFIQKRRKEFWEFYICIFMSFIWCLSFICMFIFFNLYQNIYILFSIIISAYMCLLFYAYIEYLYYLLLCMS